jgi:hypothetical protein
LVVDLPLWKIWVRQLGGWHSKLDGKIKMFQTTSQMNSLRGLISSKDVFFSGRILRIAGSLW